MVIQYTFYDWCIDNNKQWLIDYWREDLNGCSIKDVAYASNKKYWFHCGNPRHSPFQKVVWNITTPRSNVSKENICIGCKSVGAFILKDHDDEYLNKIWSDKNDCNPFEVSSGSGKIIYLRCLTNSEHPDYDLHAYNVKNTYKCPYCAGKRICNENSLANKYPEVIDIWSDLNEKTPYDYTPGSNESVYIKCLANKHQDYSRKICAHIQYGFRCPTCGRENQEHPKGSDSPNWNPNLSEDRRMRKSDEYNEWRKAVFERDGYLCQCCLDPKHNRLNAHHIKSFAQFPELRLDTNNGITLCTECHDGTVEGSLHNVYGTHNVTPAILIKYVNDKRAELGIDIPFELQGVS